CAWRVAADTVEPRKRRCSQSLRQRRCSLRGGEKWLASGKLGKGGRDVRSKPKTFRWNPAGNQSRLGSWPSTQKRVLRRLGVTQATKRRQRVPRPCYRAPKFV